MPEHLEEFEEIDDLNAVTRKRTQPVGNPDTLTDAELPQCACSEIWPGQGHPDDCPVARAFAALRKDNEDLRAKLNRFVTDPRELRYLMLYRSLTSEQRQAVNNYAETLAQRVANHD